MFAVVFPGQGSQTVGMAADFAASFPEARAVFDEADEAFGGPLSRWIERGPAEKLRSTEVTQPAILAASMAIYRVLEPQLEGSPIFFAGHSLGEYSALVAAGSLGLADAVRLVRRRGALMQQAVPEGRGAMLAVLGLDGSEVARVCAGIEGAATPANFNAPAQTVVAGESEAIEVARRALVAAGAKRVVSLDVSAPFHCALMAPAQEQLTPLLAQTDFRDARVPVVSNVTAEPYRDAETARLRLSAQVCAPVRWVDCVRALLEGGVRLQLEVGPGRVLSGLAGRIERRLARANVEKLEDLKGALDAVREVAA